MKKIFYTGFFILLAIALNSCTRDFEEINTNKNKFYEVEVNNLFPGTISRSMNFIAELNYNKLLNFSRYGIVGFATNPSQDIGDSYFNQFYVGIARDLDLLETEYEGKEGFENRLAIVKTWKSYMYYMMVSVYGSIPMSDAIATVQNKRTYKYDTEEQIYTQILSDLAAANLLYNTGSPAVGDYLMTDPVFGGPSNDRSDLVKWQKFTNTLRLNVALQCQNISMELARENVLDVMKDESKLISSVDDIVQLKWGKDADLSASYYYTRLVKNSGTFNENTYPALNEYFATYLFSYNDDRIGAYAHKGNELSPNTVAPFLHTDTLTRKHAPFCTNNVNDPSAYCPNFVKHQADGQNNLRRDSILVNYSMPYVPYVETGLASGWEWAIIPGRDYRYSDPLIRKNSPYNYSYIQDRFLKEDASMVLLNWADACFLKAEAAILFGVGNAQQYYEAGIKASFAQYGLSAKADAYMAQNGILWNTNGRGFANRTLIYRANINGKGGNANHLEQIYKQRYIADFFNGLEGWNLERRTRVLRFPPFFSNGAASDVDGYNPTYNYWTERLIYPLVEQSKNKDAYYQGIENLKAASPFYRSDRWGDNVFTSLGFAKLNPDLAIADYLWAGNKQITANVEYFNKRYGQTYEEVVVTAKQISGENDEKTALTKAFDYGFRSLLKTYIPTP